MGLTSPVPNKGKQTNKYRSCLQVTHRFILQGGKKTTHTAAKETLWKGQNWKSLDITVLFFLLFLVCFYLISVCPIGKAPFITSPTLMLDPIFIT